MQSYVLVNGKSNAPISPFNRLVQFGDGVFETVRIERGRWLFAAQHLDRLRLGAARLNLQNFSDCVWQSDVKTLIKLSNLQSAVVKLTLSRGESARGYGYSSDINSIRIALILPAPDLPSSYQLNICTSGYAHNPRLAGIKHCNRLEQILARTDLAAHDCVMLDDNNDVVSATQGNIFAVVGRTLHTPDLTSCGIRGTRRAIVLDLARELGFVVKIGALSLADLRGADEIFITNSVIGIKPVHQLEQRFFHQHQITEQLTQVLVLRVASECAKFI